MGILQLQNFYKSGRNLGEAHWPGNHGAKLKSIAPRRRETPETKPLGTKPHDLPPFRAAAVIFAVGFWALSVVPMSFADSLPGEFAEPPDEPSVIEIERNSDGSSSPTNSQPEDSQPSSSFDDEITVSLVSLVARIVDPRGLPLDALEPEELIATIGDTEVPVSAVDWYDYNAPSPAVTPAALPLTATMDEPFDQRLVELKDLAPVPASSRHLVIVMQIGGHMVVTLEGSYVRGHLKSLPGLEELLADLQPDDRVALLSFDSRFKLWRDFTTDHQAVSTSLFDAIGFGEPPAREPMPPPEMPSIARLLDDDSMRKTTSAAKAAQLLAEAMRETPGLKDIIWVGWGFGRATASAIRTMQQSDTVVSVLDVTQADDHLLGSTLKKMAEATGGTYGDLFKWPKRSIRRLKRQLGGYFVLTLDLSGLEVEGKLFLEVKGREGQVLMKPYRF